MFNECRKTIGNRITQDKEYESSRKKSQMKDDESNETKRKRRQRIRDKATELLNKVKSQEYINYKIKNKNDNDWVIIWICWFKNDNLSWINLIPRESIELLFLLLHAFSSQCTRGSALPSPKSRSPGSQRKGEAMFISEIVTSSTLRGMCTSLIIFHSIW